MKARGTRERRIAGFAALAVSLLGAPSRAAAPDTTAARQSLWNAFDVTSRSDYLWHHAFSLDNYLEFAPGGLLVRAGPVGRAAAYSRWGMGNGHAALSLNGIPLNNPQNDLAPWVDVATSGLGTLDVAPGRGWIEGSVDLNEMPAPSQRPLTFLELSKGTNDLRQRRVRFGSEAGPLGLDLSYDEVLDDGYGFNAGAPFVDGPDYGKSQSRNAAIVLRGQARDATRFAFGARQFQSTATGTLVDVDDEARRYGHLAWLDAGVGPATVTVFGRGYRSESPDSSSANETAGVIVDVGPGRGREGVSVRVAGEQIHATQDVGPGAESRIGRVSGEVETAVRAGSGLLLSLGARGAGDGKTPFVWGASALARAASKHHTVSVAAERTFRLPNIGERFLPAHAHAGFTLVGDDGVDPETAFEVRGDWELRVGVVANRVRASWIRASAAIAFRPRAVGSEVWRVASNADTEPAMAFVEDELRIDGRVGPLRVRALGAVMMSAGDREETFSSVPEFQVNASTLVGGEMFEETSALYAGAEFVHVAARSDYDGNRLHAFNVLNLLVQARLIDVRLYLKYMNVLDETYTTLGDYLMTPSTFIYGLEWTLFN